MPKKTVADLAAMKARGERLAFLAAYDAPTAALALAAGVDVLLVGDSVGMVVYGMTTTVGVTMETMLGHVRAVRRGAPEAFVVGDMPFNSFQPSDEEAVRNARRFVAEAGADAVKLEGGIAVAPRIRAIAGAGIPVMAHVGLTPQTAEALGGYKVQGKTAAEAARVVSDAAAAEAAGAFSLVLEAVPPPVASAIRRRLSIPVYGIGAGADCDGQVLVAADVLGLLARKAPRFVKRYADLAPAMKAAFSAFASEVREGRFPAPEHAYGMAEDERAAFEEKMKRRD